MSNTATLSPRSFPSVFNGFGRWMLPSRFAVWFPAKSDYQIYTTDREDWPAIRLTTTQTERTTPFYFASERGDDRSRTFTLHRPRARVHSHVDLGIWHTGGWLCRKQGSQLIPIFPILAVSDPTKLIFANNVGLHKNEDFLEWVDFQTPFFHRPILHNRIMEIPKKPAEVPLEIPVFVAEALLEKFMVAGEVCAITLEPFARGNTAVSSCYHLFRRDGIMEWRKTHKECPVCKQICSLTFC